MTTWFAKIEHVLVDPKVNFVYTKRKRRLLGLEDAFGSEHAELVSAF